MLDKTFALTTLAIAALAPAATADFIEVRQQFEFSDNNTVDPDNTLCFHQANVINAITRSSDTTKTA